MSKVRMKATDTLHISSVKSDNLLKDEEFVVPGYLAEEIERKGLPATRIGDEPDEEPGEGEGKSEAPPLNKMEPAPKAKAAVKPKPKAG